MYKIEIGMINANEHIDIMVIGASGFVGSRVVARWRNEYKILTPTHAELDITDRESVDSYFLQHTPDVVVHLAALSNTGYCEQNPDESYRVNVEGAANIARAAALCRAKLVFFSSDQVYNGNVESGLLNEAVLPFYLSTACFLLSAIAFHVALDCLFFLKRCIHCTLLL